MTEDQQRLLNKLKEELATHREIWTAEQWPSRLLTCRITLPEAEMIVAALEGQREGTVPHVCSFNCDCQLRQPKGASSEAEPRHGNGLCACGHLSSRHACDWAASDMSCFDCDCKAFTMTRPPQPEGGSGPTDAPAVCTVCRTDYTPHGQRAGQPWSQWGPGYRICKRCRDAGRDAKRKDDEMAARSHKSFCAAFSTRNVADCDCKPPKTDEPGGEPK